MAFDLFLAAIALLAILGTFTWVAMAAPPWAPPLTGKSLF
jgi:hypothetical protein